MIEISKKVVCWDLPFIIINFLFLPLERELEVLSFFSTIHIVWPLTWLAQINAAKNSLLCTCPKKNKAKTSEKSFNY